MELELCRRFLPTGDSLSLCDGDGVREGEDDGVEENSPSTSSGSLSDFGEKLSKTGDLALEKVPFCAGLLAETPPLSTFLSTVNKPFCSGLSFNWAICCPKGHLWGRPFCVGSIFAKPFWSGPLGDRKKGLWCSLGLVGEDTSETFTKAGMGGSVEFLLNRGGEVGTAR